MAGKLRSAPKPVSLGFVPKGTERMPVIQVGIRMYVVDEGPVGYHNLNRTGYKNWEELLREWPEAVRV